MPPPPPHSPPAAGLPVFYGPGGGKKDAKGKAQQVPMDTEFQFAVFWEGQEEPEMLSMEEIRPLSTDRFVDEPWLPAGIRALVKVGAAVTAVRVLGGEQQRGCHSACAAGTQGMLAVALQRNAPTPHLPPGCPAAIAHPDWGPRYLPQDGWDRKWSELSMDSMRAFLDAAKDESSRELAAAKRQQAAAQRKAQAPRKAPAACAPKGRPVAKKVPGCPGGGRGTVAWLAWLHAASRRLDSPVRCFDFI